MPYQQSQKLFQHWQLELFQPLEVLELISCLEKESQFQRNTFQCCHRLKKNLQKHKSIKSTKLIKQVEDWLSNQQEKKLKEDFLEHLLQSEFQWQLAWYQRCFGSGLQVDRAASTNTTNVYVPPPVKTRGEGHYPYFPPSFYGDWENPVRAEVKKTSKQGKESVTRKKQPLQSNSNFGLNFVNKPLSNFDLIK